MSTHTGYASLPLHGGKAPAWLFGRMGRLSREIIVYLSTFSPVVYLNDTDAALAARRAGMAAASAQTSINNAATAAIVSG